MLAHPDRKRSVIAGLRDAPRGRSSGNVWFAALGSAGLRDAPCGRSSGNVLFEALGNTGLRDAPCGRSSGNVLFEVLGSERSSRHEHGP